MELYKKIINEDVFLFFKGRSSFKYRALQSEVDSKNPITATFIHKIYYDIEIWDVKEISVSEFKTWKPTFEISSSENQGVIVHDSGKVYNFDVDIIYLNSEMYASHTQQEGSFLHGDFINVPIVFRILRQNTSIVCLPDIPTGNIKSLNGIHYVEKTTGEINPIDNSCLTNWVERENSCTTHSPTGKIQDELYSYRIEYFSGEISISTGECLTYWGPWIPKNTCQTGKPTGNVENQGGLSRIQYYSGNFSQETGLCETYWGPWTSSVEKKHFSFLGCIFLVICLFLLDFLVLSHFRSGNSWHLQSGNWTGIVLLIGLLIIVVVSLRSRYSGYFIRFLGWAYNLAFLSFIIFGAISAWNGKKNGSTSIYPQTGKNKANSINTSRQDTDFQNFKIGKDFEVDEFKTISLKWKGLDDKFYEGSFKLSMKGLNASAANLKKSSYKRFNDYFYVYQEVSNFDKNYLSDLYRMLDSIRVSNRQSKNTFALTLLAMVQNFQYSLVLDGSCSGNSTIINEELSDMINSGILCEGYYPYGIKTPLQFLNSGTGDCDSRTLLLYTIFKNFGYDVAIINSPYYMHSMLGINLDLNHGLFKKYGNRRYYFCETTSYGFLPGQLPFKYGNINYWDIEIN